MKKSILFMAGMALVVACDPAEDDISMPTGTSVTAEELEEGFIVTQYEDEDYTTEAENGNYFEFYTSPSAIVEVYQLDDEGEKDVLESGVANGRFSIVPKRGNPTTQTYYVSTQGFDGSTVTISKTAEVYVPSELTEEMRLLASDNYSYKIWKWDTEWRDDGYVWGNAGYSAGAGSEWTSGIWWGCTPEDLAEQLSHSDTGVATGEESSNAYMEFNDDGTLVTYDAGGNKIRSGKYSVTGYDGTRSQASIDGTQTEWAYGTLTTTAGSILFPFQINGGGYTPTDFEIMELDANYLRLIYAAEGTGNWSECTWWAFKSLSDPDASLTNYGEKEWTWDTDWRDDGYVWGNAGYSADAGSNWTSGVWWGCTPEDLTGQLSHSDTGEATGEESSDAYMVFSYDGGTITTYAADGTEIRSGSYSISDWGMGERTVASIDDTQSEWAYGYLNTDEGTILFPFQINGGGYKPTQFEILTIDEEQLQLIYAADGTGNWSECTWWAFKAR